MNLIEDFQRRLLAEPVSANEAADVLHAAFPDTPRERIDTDVETLIAGLRRAGLIAAAE